MIFADRQRQFLCGIVVVNQGAIRREFQRRVGIQLSERGQFFHLGIGAFEFLHALLQRLRHAVECFRELAEFTRTFTQARPAAQVARSQPFRRVGQSLHLAQNEMFPAEPRRHQRQQSDREADPRHIHEIGPHPVRRELPEPGLVDDIRQHQDRRNGHEHAGHELHPDA